jgi:hypothetical protein
MAQDVLPLTVPVPLAGALFGASAPTAYRLNLPVLDLPGRKRVAIADLERLLGTKITIEHLAQAQARLERTPSAQRRLRGQQENSEGDTKTARSSTERLGTHPAAAPAPRNVENHKRGGTT